MKIKHLQLTRCLCKFLKYYNVLSETGNPSFLCITEFVQKKTKITSTTHHRADQYLISISSPLYTNDLSSSFFVKKRPSV
jgi:hypothetical protein